MRTGSRWPGPFIFAGATNVLVESIEDVWRLAELVAADPSCEKIAAALLGVQDAARRRGERWTEIAIAQWLGEMAHREEEPTRGAVVALADQVSDRAWRKAEMQSSPNLEAEAIEAAEIVMKTNV